MGIVRQFDKSNFQNFIGGVQVGESVSREGISVFWLFGQEPSQQLNVATIEEALSQGYLKFKEQSQATVPTAKVENLGKTHVLLLGGDIVVGGLQDRVLAKDYLLTPESKPVDLSVYCVEQGRWGGERMNFKAGEIIAAPEMRSKMAANCDQGVVWDSVGNFSKRTGTHSPTYAYRDIYEQPEVYSHLQEVEMEIDFNIAKGALGAAIFIDGTLAGIDIFEDPSLFKREWTKILRASAMATYGQSPRKRGSEQLQRKSVEKILKDAASAELKSQSNAGTGTVLEFKVGKHLGTALDYKGHILHTSIHKASTN